MAEKKNSSAGKKNKNGSASKNKTKYVGKSKNLSVSFFEKNRNAIMLGYFAVGILLSAVAFITGENVWQQIRAVFFSFFGVGFYFVVLGILMLAVRMALKNMRRSLLVTNISAVMLVSSFSAVVHLFAFSSSEATTWAAQLKEAAKLGWGMGSGGFTFTGGVLGAVFGGTPLNLFGKSVSLVLLLLLFMVSLFFYLNLDVNILGDRLSDFVIRSRDKIGEKNEQRKEKNEEKKRVKDEEKLLRAELEKERLEEEKYQALLNEEIKNESAEKEVEKTLIKTEKNNKKDKKNNQAPAFVFDDADKGADSFDFNKTEIETEMEPFLDDMQKKIGVFENVKPVVSEVKKQEKIFCEQRPEVKSEASYKSSEPEAKTSPKRAVMPTDSITGGARNNERPLKQFIPQNSVFSYQGSTGGRAFGESVISQAAPQSVQAELPDDFEEIGGDFNEFEDVSSFGEKDERLSQSDKKVVKEAAIDEKTKIEKNKREVKNYKEDRKSKKQYILPSIEFLNEPKFDSQLDSEAEMRTTSKKLVEILKSFGVETKLIGVSRGPSVTRYELTPAPGVKISKITTLADDIALGLASTDVRIEAPIPNKAAVGIEVPNKKSSMVTLREVISSSEYKENHGKLLNVALGKDIAGNIRCADLAKMPHLLIAGTTGSGKSVCLNCMITSILYNATPEQVKLLMIDPKQVEFSVYNGIPHLLVPVITDARKAAGSLAWAVGEMDSRYKSFSTCGVRDIKSYNNYITEHTELELPFMPQVVLFIDELNDLMMVSPKEVEDSICRLAQKARAAGMHLVVATQRPSVDVITGIIKANIPSRLSLSVSSQVDSRTILDSVGAEKLLGNGDMLFNPVGVSKPVRIQGAYLSDSEIERIVTFIKKQSQVSYDDDIMQEIERNAAAETGKKKGGSSASSDGDGEQLDVLINEAMNIVTSLNSASTTVIQRKLSVGYARAARIMDQLEQLGCVSPAEGNKPRKVLITRAQYLETQAKGETAVDDYDVLSD